VSAVILCLLPGHKCVCPDSEPVAFLLVTTDGHQSGVPMIPLMVEEGYRATGW
jgi:hypothetical protein